MAQSSTKKIRSFLNKLDLNEKEITMYLKGISLPPQHVSQLGKLCNLTRTNAYDVVKKLEEKGLCHNLGSLYGRKIENASSERAFATCRQKSI